MFQPLHSYAWPPLLSTSPSAENLAGPESANHGLTVVGFDERDDWQGVTAQNSLRHYFVQQVLEEVNSEMKDITGHASLRSGDSVGLTWSKVTKFSFLETLELFQSRAPVTWSVMTVAAVGKLNGGHLQLAHQEAWPSASGHGSNNMWDPWLVKTFIIKPTKSLTLLRDAS
jgi:hypothetical protein